MSKKNFHDKLASKADEANLPAYRQELVRVLLEEIFKLIKSEEKINGIDSRKELTYSLLASLVSTIVYNELKESALRHQGSGIQEHSKRVYSSFKECKMAIEECIGSGFAGAFNSFNPDHYPDYMCEITCVDVDMNDDTGVVQ